MRPEYPSDLTREDFELVKPILESVSKITRPRVYDLYDIFCAILYVLREGCRWRSLPHEFPNWTLVYYYFNKWSKKDDQDQSAIDKALQKLVQSERFTNGRELKTSMVIVDSKTIKNADTAEEKGYDGGKKNLRHKSASCG